MQGSADAEPAGDQAGVLQRYAQLRADLARAYEARPWRSEEIDSIADRLARTEAELASIWALLPMN